MVREGVKDSRGEGANHSCQEILQRIEGGKEEGRSGINANQRKNSRGGRNGLRTTAVRVKNRSLHPSVSLTGQVQM